MNPVEAAFVLGWNGLDFGWFPLSSVVRKCYTGKCICYMYRGTLTGVPSPPMMVIEGRVCMQEDGPAIRSPVKERNDIDGER